MHRGSAVLFWGSLGILFVLLALWVRSYFATQLHLYVLDGRLVLFSIEASDLEYINDVVDHGPRQAVDYLTHSSNSQSELLGLGCWRGEYNVRINSNNTWPRPFTILAMPMWPALLLATTTALLAS